MPDNSDHSFLTRYGKYISVNSTNPTTPFKDHAQFPALIDILSRKESHHAILLMQVSVKIQNYFLESLARHLSQAHAPSSLHNAILISLDANLFILDPALSQHKSIENYFIDLQEKLDRTDTCLIIALNNAEIVFTHDMQNNVAFLRKQIEMLLNHPKCRLLFFTQAKNFLHYPDLAEHFVFMQIRNPSAMDLLTILKHHRAELEKFHLVEIPDELLSSAYSLAERFLSTSEALEKSLLLLDSSAARTKAIENSANVLFKPIVTMNVLTSVLSAWTHIPATHLQLNNFKLSRFVNNIQHTLFGQDVAIDIMGHELQRCQAHLQPRRGPLCSLLFAGAEHTGKTTAAVALSQDFFQTLQPLFIAQSTLSINSITEIKFQRYADKVIHASIEDILRQTPYAIILFKNIHLAPAVILDQLYEICSTGYLHLSAKVSLDFRQVILLLSTSLGNKRLSELAKVLAPINRAPDIDLMQLVLNERKRKELSGHYYSPQEISDEIMPEITAHLPTALCQHIHVVPFFPLSKEAIEKIIHVKLGTLAQQLAVNYSIELSYAPEIVRYLSAEVLIKREMDNQGINIDKALKQIYFIVEQAMINQADSRYRSNQLFIKLNETGQLLRCDWIMPVVRHHA